MLAILKLLFYVEKSFRTAKSSVVFHSFFLDNILGHFPAVKALHSEYIKTFVNIVFLLLIRIQFLHFHPSLLLNCYAINWYITYILQQAIGVIYMKAANTFPRILSSNKFRK